MEKASGVLHRLFLFYGQKVRKRVALIAGIKHLPHIASFCKTRIMLYNYKACIKLVYIITNLFVELDTRVKICYYNAE